MGWLIRTEMGVRLCAEDVEISVRLGRRPGERIAVLQWRNGDGSGEIWSSLNCLDPHHVEFVCNLYRSRPALRGTMSAFVSNFAVFE